MIVRYLDFIERLEYELIQRQDEGLDVSLEQSHFKTIKDQADRQSREKFQEEAKQILCDLSTKAIPAELASREPDEIGDIRRTRTFDSSTLLSGTSMDPSSRYNAVLGGWLGRAAGCLLGKPVERYHRTVIRELLEANGTWPLDNYFTEAGMPQGLLKKYPWKRRGGFESLRENIQCMPEDDDLNFTMLNLYVLETYGAGFTSEDVGTAWLNMLPAFEVFTAERVAYRNLLDGISPPDSAQYLNPFREWIGAQIRADLWGYVCPGDPEKAAELAWRDARVSHVRNGIYGEMFFAAIIAAAFVEKDMRKLIQLGLDQIPPKSRLSKAISFVLDIPMEKRGWEDVVDQLYEAFGHYHWVHTINNAALSVAALLHGEGDYSRTICNAVMGGWDTDCNGATTGSVLGVSLGAQALPEKWIFPLNNRIRSSLGGFDHAAFTDLAQRTVEVAKGVITRDAGGKLAGSDDY